MEPSGNDTGSRSTQGRLPETIRARFPSGRKGGFSVRLLVNVAERYLESGEMGVTPVEGMRADAIPVSVWAAAGEIEQRKEAPEGQWGEK